MKYGFYINQLAVIENGLKLDIVDLAIFDCIKDFTASLNCKKLIEGERIYYWLKWSWLSKECPILGLNTRQSVTARYNKLIDAKMLMAHPDNQKLQQAFYCFGENCNLLLSVNKSLHGVNKNVHGVNESLQVRVNESLHTLATDVYTDNNTNNKETINKELSENKFSQNIESSPTKNKSSQDEEKNPLVSPPPLTASEIDSAQVPENTNPAFFELLRTFAKAAVKKAKSKRLQREGWELMVEKFTKASSVVSSDILADCLKEAIANSAKWNTPFYTDWWTKNITAAKQAANAPKNDSLGALRQQVEQIGYKCQTGAIEKLYAQIKAVLPQQSKDTEIAQKVLSFLMKDETKKYKDLNTVLSNFQTILNTIKNAKAKS